MRGDDGESIANLSEANRSFFSLAKLAGWRDFRRSLLTTAVLLFTVGLMVVLVRKVDFSALRSALVGFDVRIAVPSLGLMVIIVLTVAARWKLVLSLLDYRIELRRSALVILATSAVNAVVPAKAGNLIKVASLRGILPMATVLGAAISEAMLDLSILGLLAFAGGLSTGHALTAAVALAIAAGAAGFMAFSAVLPRLPFPERFRVMFAQFSAVMDVYRRRPLRFLAVAAATTAIWLMMIVLTWLLYRGVGADASLLQVCSALPLAIFVGLLPLTLSGIGTRDAALIVLMAPFVSEAQSLAVGLLYTAIVFWLPAIIGAPLLRRALTPK